MSIKTEPDIKKIADFILKCMFVDKLGYDLTSRLVKDKFKVDYEGIAYKMDEEGYPFR